MESPYFDETPLQAAAFQSEFLDRSRPSALRFPPANGSRQPRFGHGGRNAVGILREQRDGFTVHLYVLEEKSALQKEPAGRC
jgi:hypothetical protein